MKKVALFSLWLTACLSLSGQLSDYLCSLVRPVRAFLGVC